MYACIYITYVCFCVCVWVCIYAHECVCVCMNSNVNNYSIFMTSARQVGAKESFNVDILPYDKRTKWLLIAVTHHRECTLFLTRYTESSLEWGSCKQGSGTDKGITDAETFSKSLMRTFFFLTLTNTSQRLITNHLAKGTKPGKQISHRHLINNSQTERLPGHHLADGIRLPERPHKEEVNRQKNLIREMSRKERRRE